MSVAIGADDRMYGYMLSNSHLGFIALLENKDREETVIYSGMSVMNLLGYIPGVSVIVGVARIIFSQILAYFNNSNDSKVKALQEAQLVRGVMECCTVFGPLMVITDIAASIFFLIMASSQD